MHYHTIGDSTAALQAAAAAAAGVMTFTR